MNTSGKISFEKTLRKPKKTFSQNSWKNLRKSGSMENNFKKLTRYFYTILYMRSKTFHTRFLTCEKWFKQTRLYIKMKMTEKNNKIKHIRPSETDSRSRTTLHFLTWVTNKKLAIHSHTQQLSYLWHHMFFHTQRWGGGEGRLTSEKTHMWNTELTATWSWS